MLNTGVGLWQFGSAGSISDGADGGLSAAALLLAAYGPYGMVIDFSDQSIAIKNSGGSLDYSSTGNVLNGALVGPSAKLTYTAPSVKMTEQADGYYAFQAHNLYLNSAAPANQSITVLSGASYSVTITGATTVTASGAATGTWTAGTNTFTAATSTLTLGSTSGAGTVHVRRTPSNSDYIATTSAALYALPYTYTSGECVGIRQEEAATNLHLYSTQYDNAAWVKSSVNVTPNAVASPSGETDADLIANTTTSALIYQVQASLAAGTYTRSFWLRTVSGATETVPYFTNGAGSSPNPRNGTITVTGTWQRFEIPVVSVGGTVNVGFGTISGVNPWAVSSGVYAWQDQLELGTIATSPIITYGAAVTRAADNDSLAEALYPYSGATGTMFCDFTPLNGNASSPYILATAAAGQFVYQSGTSVSNTDGTNVSSYGAITVNTRTRVAVAYGGATKSSAKDGALAVTDGSFDGTFASGALGLGSVAGANGANFDLHRVAFFTTKASNATLPTIGA